MSKTAIVWLILYLVGIVASFVKGPFIGLMTYMFTFYTQLSWSRSAPHLRWSLIVGVIVLLTYLIKKKNLQKLNYTRIPSLKWLILIIINMMLVTPFAFDPVENQQAIVDFLKIIILYFLITNIVRTKAHYKIFIWVQVFGNYLFGWQAWSSGRLVSGRLEHIGGPGVKGSNYLANHLVMIIPFLATFFLRGRWYEKLIIVIAGAFIMNAIILCSSRGSFLAIAVMAIVMILLSPSKIKINMIIGVVLCSVLFMYLTDDRFWERMVTIQTFEEDGSAMGRVDSWLAAIEMIKDYPFGGGGGGWEMKSPVYIPDIVYAHGGEHRSVHNTFIMMATDWGIQGLTLWLLFLGSTCQELHRIRKRRGAKDEEFYIQESIAIEASIIAFLVAALFGNRIYAESLYWFCALATALSNIQQSELIEIESANTAKQLLKKNSKDKVA